jgi:hypothetical protein
MVNSPTKKRVMVAMIRAALAMSVPSRACWVAKMAVTTTTSAQSFTSLMACL